MEKQDPGGNANNCNPAAPYPSLPNQEPRNEIQIGPLNLSASNLRDIRIVDNSTTSYRSHSTRFGPEKQMAICQSCHSQSMTNTVAKVSTRSHIMAALLCGFLCWPCAWIPYCVPSWKNTIHYCANCGAFLGTYKP